MNEDISNVSDGDQNKNIVDRRKFNGGHSTKGVAGRKPKAEEVKLQQRLTPMSKAAFKKLKEGIEAGDFKFIQLFFAYYVGKPKETKEINIQSEQPLFNLLDAEPLNGDGATIDIDGEIL